MFLPPFTAVSVVLSYINKEVAGSVSAWHFHFNPYHMSISFRCVFLSWFLELPVGRPGAVVLVI
jgi:uncharacterized membrane protein